MTDLNTRSRATVAEVSNKIREYLTKIGIKHIIYESCNDNEEGKIQKDCSVSVVFTVREAG